MGTIFDNLRPVSIDVTSSIKPTSPVTLAGGLLFATVSLPVFSISGIPWLGASFIAIEFPVNFGEVINLLRPIAKPSGVNFCLAIRWLDSNGLVVRRKLWENVGEVLCEDLYAGENINYPCTFEVWTSEDFSTVSSASSQVFQTNKVSAKQACLADCSYVAENTGSDIQDILFSPYIHYYGEIPLPIVFIETLIQVINRIS